MKWFNIKILGNLIFWWSMNHINLQYAVFSTKHWYLVSGKITELIFFSKMTLKFFYKEIMETALYYNLIDLKLENKKTNIH